jgi:hypothetical protein
MTGTSFHASAEPSPADTSDALVHLTCCLDDTRALCGEVLTTEAVEAGPVADDVPHDCVVCDDLVHTAPAFCPLRPLCAIYAVPV